MLQLQDTDKKGTTVERTLDLIVRWFGGSVALDDALGFVREVQAAPDAVALPSSTPDPRSADAPDFVGTIFGVDYLIGQGKYIQAIKEIRAATGWGLKDAKDVADKHRDRLRAAWGNNPVNY